MKILELKTGDFIYLTKELSEMYEPKNVLLILSFEGNSLRCRDYEDDIVIVNFDNVDRGEWKPWTTN